MKTLTAFVLLSLAACGGRMETVEQQPEPISLCVPGGGATGMTDPVKFCEMIPWNWTDVDGNVHDCHETCVTGSVCHYDHPDYEVDPMFCVQPPPEWK